MRHIIYSAVPWCVHLITAILSFILLLWFGRAIVKCYQFHTTKRKQTPQYVTKPAFGATEEEEQEEVYETHRHSITLSHFFHCQNPLNSVYTE